MTILPYLQREEKMQFLAHKQFSVNIMAYPSFGGAAMEVSLDQLCLGQQGTVTAINAPLALCKRLRAFGMVPGTCVVCRYRTPGGSVTALELRSSVIALRTRDMRYIRVSC